MGIVARSVRQAHLSQQLLAMGFNICQNSGLVCLEIGLLLGQKLAGQGHVLERRVLGKEIEGLEHHAEVEPLFANLALPLGSGVRRVKQSLALDNDRSLIRRLQEIQAPQ